MRVFVAVQPTPSTGTSSLSRYVAKSKVDREREQLDEKGARPLFSAEKNDLNYSEADHLLNPTGRELEKEDVIHVVVSPERGTFERVGKTDEERQDSFREAVRESVREIERELKVRSLSWFGGLHGNTRTPHAHLAISRWAIDLQTGKLVYIKHLPESLLPRNLEQDDGTKKFSAGKIAEVFARSLNRRRQPVRFLNIENVERDVDVSRSVLSPHALMLRDPTQAERVVGKWLEMELNLARDPGERNSEQAELERECASLRNQVAEIDAQARANGMRPPAGYIEPEKLEDLIRGNASSLGISVFSERPQGQPEKFVEVAQAMTGARETEQPTDHTEQKGRDIPIPPILVEETPSPAKETAARQERPGKEQVRGVVWSQSARNGARRIDHPTKSKVFGVKEKSEETGRVATKTLAELRSDIIRTRASGEMPAISCDAHEKGAQHEVAVDQEITRGSMVKTVEALKTVENSDRQSTDLSLEQFTSATPAHTEIHPPVPGIAVGKEANLKDPAESQQITDEELGSLAQWASFNRQYLERNHTLIKNKVDIDLEQLKSRGARNPDLISEAREPLACFEFRLREAILLDEIYDSARRKREITEVKLTNGQEDLLKGRESLSASVASDTLPHKILAAREQLPAIAPFANQEMLDDYQKYREENYLKLMHTEDMHEHAHEDELAPKKAVHLLKDTLHQEREIGATEKGNRQAEQAALLNEVKEIAALIL